MNNGSTECKYKSNKHYAVRQSLDELFYQLNCNVIFKSEEKGAFDQYDYNTFLKDKSKYYFQFYINKANGGKREINAPNKLLLAIQHYILNKHLYTFGTHKCAHGFVRGRSIVTNAINHISQSHVYNVDIRDFFHTISKEQVYNLFIKRGYSNQCASCISEICTVNDCLPQGAPTSPALSNIICYKMDSRLDILAKKCKLEYSRYADDITFSGLYIKRSLRDTIKRIIHESGFNIAINKEQITKNKKNFRQTVTGLVVNKKISIGRTRYNKLRGLIHGCKTKGLHIIQEETKTKHGPGYFIQKDLSNFRTDIFKYLIGIFSNLWMIQEYSKCVYLLHNFTLFNWEEYYRYRAIKTDTPLDKTVVNRVDKTINKLINNIRIKIIELKSKQFEDIKLLYYENREDKIRSIDDELYKLKSRLIRLEHHTNTIRMKYIEEINNIKKQNGDLLIQKQVLEKQLRDSKKRDSDKIITSETLLNELLGPIKAELIQLKFNSEKQITLMEGISDKLTTLTDDIRNEFINKNPLPLNDPIAYNILITQLTEKLIDSIRNELKPRQNISDETEIKNGLGASYGSLNSYSKEEICFAEYMKTEIKMTNAWRSILCLCKTIEREILLNIFNPFKGTISEPDDDYQKVIPDDYIGKITGWKLSYQMVHMYCEQRKELNLGNFGFIMRDAIKKQQYYLFQKLINFIKEKYHNQFDQIRIIFIKCLDTNQFCGKNLADLRNYCAHPKDINDEEYESITSWPQYNQLVKFTIEILKVLIAEN